MGFYFLVDYLFVWKVTCLKVRVCYTPDDLMDQQVSCNIFENPNIIHVAYEKHDQHGYCLAEESFVNKLNLDLNHAQLSTICKQGLHDFPPFPADQHPLVQPCLGKARVFIVSRP